MPVISHEWGCIDWHRRWKVSIVLPTSIMRHVSIDLYIIRLVSIYLWNDGGRWRLEEVAVLGVTSVTMIHVCDDDTWSMTMIRVWIGHFATTIVVFLLSHYCRLCTMQVPWCCPCSAMPQSQHGSIMKIVSSIGQDANSCWENRISETKTWKVFLLSVLRTASVSCRSFIVTSMI